VTGGTLSEDFDYFGNTWVKFGTHVELNRRDGTRSYLKWGDPVGKRT
jgi:hypothetical protein